MPDDKKRPTHGDLKRCLQERHNCSIQQRQPPMTVFPGADNEDGPTTYEHPRRMLAPDGVHYVPDIDDFKDDEEASPSTHDYFCRRLGLLSSQVHVNDPEGGRVKSEVPSMSRVNAAMTETASNDDGHECDPSLQEYPEITQTQTKVRPITGADGHRGKRPQVKR